MIPRHLLVAAAALASLPFAASAAVSSVNYAAVVRANQNAVNSYRACAGDTRCQTKVLNSVAYRISTNTSRDSALTAANQRATARQLNEIFQRSLNCPSGSEAACANQNSKTFGSLTYRISNQASISPS